MYCGSVAVSGFLVLDSRFHGNNLIMLLDFFAVGLELVKLNFVVNLESFIEFYLNNKKPEETN